MEESIRGLVEDLKSALRQVRKNPQLVILITVILGLGVGANATISSLIDAAGHLPIRDQESIVLLWSVNQGRALDRTPVSLGDFADIKTRLHSLKDLAAFSEDTAHLTSATEPVRLSVERVTTNFFSVLGVQPAIGRNFNAGDPDASEPAVILSHSSWQNQFGSDPAILSRTIKVNGLSHKVIGVMKPEFQYLSSDVALWMPMKDPATTDDRSSRDLITVGRLQRLGDTQQVQAEIDVLSRQLASEHPNTDAGWQFSLTGAIPVRRAETIVLALVIGLPFLILGIACANIVNILLARGVGRNREIAVRIALGASRSRIVRLLLIESAVYALIGGVAGVLAGIWGIDLVKGFNFLWANAKVDAGVLAASVATALCCGLLFGLTPALHASRMGIAETLKRTSGKATIDRKGHRLRSALMVGEVAVATVLLLLTAFAIRSVMELRAINTGFRIEGVQTFRTEILDYRYSSSSEAVKAHLAILDSLRQLPGVQYAGAETRVPTQGGRNNPTQQIEIEGRVYPDVHERDWGMDLTVTPGYFEALGVPLLSGRYFNVADAALAPPVAVVGLTMAKKYWNGSDAVGRRFRLSDAGSQVPWITIAGVVGDVRNDAADALPAPMVYFPLTQRPARTLTYVLQRSGRSPVSAAAIRTAVSRVESGLPIYDMRTMGELLNEDLSGTYFTAGLFGVLGVIALSLAAIGIFGVLSHVTSEHTSEIAIRMDLGAESRQIVRGFIWKALRLASIGIAIGGLATLASFRIIRGALYGVSSTDPLALGFTLCVLLLAATVACYLPARRATKLDPMTVLRWE